MKIKHILQELEDFAPIPLQENYDNCGIQLGNEEQLATGALLCLDVTEDVIDEALENGCNLIISHHPLLFSGLKNITGKNQVERIILKSIKNDIVIYAAHTNFDNVKMGVNDKFADKLNLKNKKILSPISSSLYKLYTYIPEEDYQKVASALFDAGAGNIGNYSHCGFRLNGIGTFKPQENAQPYIGESGGEKEEVKEIKLEVIVPSHLKSTVLKALFEAHPYEEVAYELIRIENKNQDIGAGLIGDLPEEMAVSDFLEMLKTNMQTECIKFTKPHIKTIKKVAVCGGSGSFLLKNAFQQKADIFISSDFKYHQFFEAENAIMIADIGHYESEQFTTEIFSQIIRNKFPKFATYFTTIRTNPVNYYF